MSNPTVESSPPPAGAAIDYAPPTLRARDVVPHKSRRRTSLSARGEPMLWLTGGCIVVCCLMIIGLLAFILYNGLAAFWPKPLVHLTLPEGKVVLGEPARTDELVTPDEQAPGGSRRLARTLYQTGNYELTNEDFTWVDDPAVIARTLPEWALVIERAEWGRAYGTIESITVDGKTTTGSGAAWEKFQEVHGPLRESFRELKEQHEKVGAVSDQQEQIRRRAAGVAMTFGEDSAEHQAKVAESAPRLEELERTLAELAERTKALEAKVLSARVTVRTADGQVVPADRADPEVPLTVAQVVRAYPANRLGFGDKLGVYFSRWWEYLADDPRESNTEGGVFPAIVGTVLLTFTMILFVVPLGVVAAIYLREYAKQGVLVSIIRISVNNLAGVPSIVYGVFGLGFFCYALGAYIDGGPENAWAGRLWLTTVALTLLLVLTATAALFFAGRFDRAERHVLAKALRIVGGVLWVLAGLLLFVVLAKTPFFDGFFPVQAAEGNPVFGKSALIWASLTLALLTLPVVIVATEEALAAVPRSMREGSYACGASKWQTIRKIVLPRAMPGIMTGMVLAIARGAGEVAPIMLVGAVKLAPELPISANPGEQFGANRSFMHLGFHIYDLAFQSRNSMAALPMVFTTTLLLILIVVMLNLAAIGIRARLRKAYAGGHF